MPWLRLCLLIRCLLHGSVHHLIIISIYICMNFNKYIFIYIITYVFTCTKTTKRKEQFLGLLIRICTYQCVLTPKTTHIVYSCAQKYMQKMRMLWKWFITYQLNHSTQHDDARRFYPFFCRTISFQCLPLSKSKDMIFYFFFK